MNKKLSRLIEPNLQPYFLCLILFIIITAAIQPALAAAEGAALVAQGEKVTAPILMFASDGSGGTGYDKETWRRFQTDFAAAHPDARVIELDCPHYVHDYAYAEIAEQMADFFTELAEKNQEG